MGSGGKSRSISIRELFLKPSRYPCPAGENALSDLEGDILRWNSARIDVKPILQKSSTSTSMGGVSARRCSNFDIDIKTW